MAGIAIRGVQKTFGKVPVIHGIDLEFGDGEFVVLVGPSGCGKSTLLRMIAGLEGVTGGEIAIGDRVVNDLPPRDRDVAMVFQDYALYPHKSVYDNMAFGLRMRRSPKEEIAARVKEASDVLQIGHLLERKPGQLSGGQRQRVAMGRAIVRRPQVFLFDEPLSNPRRAAAWRGAGGDQEAAPALRHHHRVRDPRSGGGHDARRPHRGAARRQARTIREPERDLQPPGVPLRRELHGSPPMSMVPAKVNADGRASSCSTAPRSPFPTAAAP
jgi:ABC-type lipoprotein export system ATPase subunit